MQNHEQHYGIEHMAVETDDYAGTLAQLRRNGVRILEELPPNNGRHVCVCRMPGRRADGGHRADLKERPAPEIFKTKDPSSTTIANSGSPQAAPAPHRVSRQARPAARIGVGCAGGGAVLVEGPAALALAPNTLGNVTILATGGTIAGSGATSTATVGYTAATVGVDALS